MNWNLEDARRIAVLLAEAAEAEILPRFNRLQDGEVRAKSSAIDLVTDADEAAERHIAAALRAAHPGAVVVGEEATAKAPSLLQSIADAELAFVVDPVDGTRNFVAGLPLFGVMAAAIVRGEIAAGVIHDPIGRNTAFAVRGQGAWLRLEDGTERRLRVAAPVEPARMDAMVGITHLSEPLRSTVAANVARLGASGSLRCAAHEYRLVAAGHSHAALYGKLMPWDHAPGWLLHHEAGGHAAHFDGTPYRPTRFDGGLLCAPDEASWQALRRTLLGD